MLDPELKNKINRMLNIFENDSGSPETDYTTIYLYHDGNNGRKQVTLGRGFTDDGGNLKKVLDIYISKRAKYSDKFPQYSAQCGRGTLCNDKEFLKLLVLASKEDQAMKDAQDETFDLRYWDGAIKFAQSNGFDSPLGIAVIMDSYLHSGGILGFLRKRFDASVPASGGDEKEWIESYVRVRREWLLSKGKPLSNTLYRPDFFITQMKKGNWDFNCPLVANGRTIC